MREREGFMDWVEDHAFGIIITIGVISFAAKSVATVMKTKAEIDVMKAQTNDISNLRIGDKFVSDGQTYKVIEVTKF